MDWLNLAIALGLGLLVGLERERTETEIAGIRTFPLITVFGFVTAHLAATLGGWLVAAGLVALGAVLVVGNLLMIRQEQADPGMTTEIAALVMFGVGALLASGERALPIVLGGGVAVLLYWKVPMHRFVEEVLGEADLRAIVRLVLLGLVIAPVLPNRSFGPYDVLNPFEIWLMVVLIEGITLGAYVAYKLVGARAGTLLSGALGGLISSTATTVSYARRSREQRDLAAAAAVVVALASTVVFVRVGVEIAVVAPGLLRDAAAPLGVIMAAMLLATGAAWLTGRGKLVPRQELEPPSELGVAVSFGLVYALVLLAVAVAREHLGEGALYAVAALSGLTDVDAITLSTAQLVNRGGLGAGTGWRLIAVGALANLVFKGGVVALLGSPALLRRVAWVFGAGLVAGALVLGLWPG